MKVEEIEIPDAWCDRLAQLRQYDPNAIIAGGAIRDLYCGVAPKDVDYFTTHNEIAWPGQIDSTMDYEGMMYVEGVLGFAGYDDYEIDSNLIIIKPALPEDLIASFDFGLCQIAFDGAKIIRTAAFNWDFKHSIFTLTKIDRYPRSIKRFARINQRYGNEIRIPELDNANALPR